MRMQRTFMTTLGSLLAGLVFAPATVLAAPGLLADSPLFLQSQVKSNIFFVLDDSGSMDWEHLLTERAAEPGVISGEVADWIYLDPTPSEENEWREFCTGYNAMAYNPNVTYTPWVGKDQDGDTFDDIGVTAAPFNPYSSSSDTLNLTSNACQEEAMEDEDAGACWTNTVGFFYVQWVDANGNGLYDDMECLPDRADIPTDGGDYFPNNVRTGGHAQIVYVKDMSADQQENYANWFSYYRKREYVMKRAVSELVQNSSNRVGMATLNNRAVDGQGSAIAVDDVASGTHRADVLERLFNVYSSGGTPLRNGLEEAGQYFDQDDGGLSHDNLSGEPSPILSVADGGECQQNFAVVMSDGYWNGSSSSLANFIQGDNHDGDGNSAWDGGPMADNWDTTLADIAMYYYETDLAPSLPDNVRTIDGIDENEAQHLVTFTVALGLKGTLSTDPPADRTGTFAWPQPVADTATTLDDMVHAAYNGRGEFLSAKDPAGLVSSLNAAIAAIDDRSGSASSVSFNTSQLTADSVIYRARFNSARWSGDVEAYDLDPLTGDIGATPVWSVADVLDGQGSIWGGQDSRTILTYDGTDGVPFTWGEVTHPTTPIPNALADLTADIPNVGTMTAAEIADFAEARLDYIRGDRSNEGTGYFFRTRESRLGDIVHSTPVYVGKPALQWPDVAPFPTADGERYSQYKAAVATRQPIVYVAANDGMLHGFDAQTGTEEIAYIPSILFSSATNEGLHYLTQTDYIHRYYADLDPTLSDVYIRTTPIGSASWRTVLVGGLRGGGRGIYALDVTDPTNFQENGGNPEDVVLWEFTSDDDADLGYTFSRPSIALMDNGKWAAIFGNGYNDTGSGEASLFIVFLEEGLDGTWDINADDYIKISTGVGDTTNRNGLNTPTVADLDGNGTADRVYAGDLEGNVWVFDLSGANEGNWGSVYSQGQTPKPLFTAEANQPITARIGIARHPSIPNTNQNLPNIMVYFGTGQYLTQADKTTTDPQAFYGVWDSGTDELTQSDLVEQTFTTAGGGNIVVTNNPVNYGAADYGWFLTLPEVGERQLTTPILRDNIVYFTSMTPESDPCSFGTTGYLTALSMINGGPPPKGALDFNNDGVIDEDDLVDDQNASRKESGGGIADPKTLGDNIYNPDPSGETSRETIPPIEGDRTGRLSWQELL